MTRYDPFAKSPAKSDSTRVAPPRHEEDMLFATGEPVKQGPPVDSSWELLNEDVGSLLPNAGISSAADDLFATEILGEEVAAPAKKPQAPRATGSAAPRPSQKLAQPKQTQPKQAQPQQVQPKQVTPLGAAAAPRVAVRTEATPETPATEPRVRTPLPPIMPKVPVRQRHWVAQHAPSLVFGVGASVAAWFALMQRHYVLAAIVGTATIVGVLFTRLSQRR